MILAHVVPRKLFLTIMLYYKYDFHFRGTPIWPYCDKIRQEPYNLSCNVGRSSVALCNLYRKSKALPREYQVRTAAEFCTMGESVNITLKCN